MLTLRLLVFFLVSPAHPIDAFVSDYFAKNGLALSDPVPDALFARRVYLDLWGLPPTPEQLEEFIADAGADKRERLVEHLLGDRKNYTEHWVTFWNDLLRNDEGVVYHGTRESISKWLYKALEDNLPYDRFVAALLNPTLEDDPKGFLIGVNWRGEVSASQTPAMQAAQNSAQVFLGVNLKCASCHDSFVNRWKLEDSYGMAALFSEKPLTLVRCDVDLGIPAEPKFLFAELGAIKPPSVAAERRAEAARLFTTRRNERFARTLVNRIWKKLLGEGLVEPVDDMDTESWNAELLDWLASDFVDHDYDIKFLLRRIMTSRAYQLPAVGQSSEKPKHYTFNGPYLRRLNAEQFTDAVCAITGEWRTLQSSKADGGTYARDWRLKSTALTRALGRPIRDQVFTERSSHPTTLQTLELVNGDELGYLLQRGAKRWLGELKAAPENLFDSGITSSGQASVDVDISGAKQLWLLIEDVDSYDREQVVAGWAQAELISPQGTAKLADLKGTGTVRLRRLRIVERPPGASARNGKSETVHHDYPEALVTPIPSTLVYDIAGRGFTRFHALVGIDQSSMRSDIHPRIRCFVFTEEPDRRQLIRVVGETPVPRTIRRLTAGELITYLYRYALSRDPEEGEHRLAMSFLQTPGAAGKPSSEGLEDLLWALFLSPDFQYIR